MSIVGSADDNADIGSSTGAASSILSTRGFVAGLGNIYCSEILFDAGVNPEKICNPELVQSE